MNIIDYKKTIILFIGILLIILPISPISNQPLILLGSLSTKFIITKISVDSFFLKVIYFILFLLTLDTLIFITSLIGLTEELNFNIWINRFVLSILSFPLIVYLLEILLFKDKKKSNTKFL